MSIKKKLFGTMPCGKEVYSYTLRNKNGMKVKLCEYGGAIMQIKVPDKKGSFDDVVCGYNSLDSYIGGDGYQGALIGRVGNRIAKGRFTLDGKEYSLFINNGPNSLHGGEYGFNAKVWESEAIDGDEPKVVFSTESPDGDEGYPGTLKITVVYTLTEKIADTLDTLQQNEKGFFMMILLLYNRKSPFLGERYYCAVCNTIPHSLNRVLITYV